MKRLNLGCGACPTPGWHNYDNSLTVRLARHPILCSIVDRVALLSETQREFVHIARQHDIRWADCTKRIPEPDGSVEVVYACHVVEHLDRKEIKAFLREARRILLPDGILRLGFPDLRKMVDRYIADGDADALVERTLLASPKPRTFLDRLRYLAVGERHHLWMYDSSSMVKLLSSMGFKEACEVPPGSTAIPDPGLLDLYEREEETVYVETRSPGTE
jgi:SAM-dependent methyltransferase